MMKFLGALALLAAAPSVAAQPPPADADVYSRAFDDAQQHRDATRIGRMLAPDFRIVHGSGRVGDRADFLNDFADADVQFAPFVITDRRLTRLTPDVTMVTAEALVRGTAAGRPFADHFRFTDLFQRRGGRWWAVFTQVTPLPAPAP